MRISVIGLSGSGKSTLARKISEKLSIPYIQLDRFWFEADGLRVEQGRATPEEVEKVRTYVRKKALAAIEGDSWVSDGFYGRIQPNISGRANAIVYLNIPLMLRMWAHAKRMFKPGRHPELSLLHEIRFFPEMIRRTYAKGPAIRDFAKANRDKVVELRSWKEADAYLSSLH